MSLLTIMLPTTVDRRKTFYPLLSEITKQISEYSYSDIVEILIDEDNKEKSIGKKRQDLLTKAQGQYVVGIDSDDFISPTYMIDIICSLKNNPGIDHVGFEEKCIIDGEIKKSIFSIRHKKWQDNVDGYDFARCANPKSVIKREKALIVGYEDIRYSEDRIFSEIVTQLLVDEVFVEKQLYIYQYNKTPHNERYGIYT